ncbi:hypothetical protein BURC_01628 [Burkholderiaceae bacterium]|jgi:hypothetical protein|nr:hypothetical protein BURC_01628 [Burkholderiaceae bacterium]
MGDKFPVIPAKAGIHEAQKPWIPARTACVRNDEHCEA